MKLTLFLLTAFMLNASAKTFSQTITFNGKNVSLEKVFREIKKQTNYAVVCNADLLDKAGRVSISVTNEPLTDFLNVIFKGQNLEYSITKTTIVVSQKQNVDQQAPKNLESPVEIQTLLPISISGKVTDEEGKPLVGASIVVKGKGRGTTTNADGIFVLSGVEVGDIIIISFTGFISQSFTAGQKTDFSVKLKVNDNPLDQVQILAYGKTTQRRTTSNVTTVTSKDIEKQPVTNALLALQGQVPGLVINQASGFGNSGVTVQIQGPNSLLKSNVPFYVIDGVPYPSQSLPGITTGVLGVSHNGYSRNYYNEQNGSPLSFINPLDIESISVLKDADATAIYGSQAANGAILITTKKGKAGRGNVSLNLQQGIAEDKRFMKLMNREQYLQMRKDAFAVDGLPIPSIITNPSDQNYDLNGVWDNNRETDWQKVLLGGRAKYTNLQGTVTGGTTLDQFRVSVNYNRQTTIYPTDLADQRGSMHMSLNHSSPNERFKMRTSVMYMIDDNELPIGNLVTDAYSLVPVAPALYKSDGTLNWETGPNGTSTWYNPLSMFNAKSSNKTANLIGNFNIGYNIAKNIILSSNFGYNNQQQEEVQTFPLSIFSPDDIANGAKPFSRFASGNVKSWNIEPQLNYNMTVGAAKLDAYVGTAYRQTFNNFKAFTGNNYSTDQLLENLQAAGNVSIDAYQMSEYRYAALFGHAGLDWRDKYLVNVNIRRDGSSRFGHNNVFHSFWSVAGGWVFSEEKWIKESLPWLSFGKLNLSYGTSGSDGIGDYAFLNTYSSSRPQNAYQGVVPLNVNGLPNPNLQWEETDKLNSGLSLGFLRDRLVIAVNYYQNRCSNQLLSYALPYSAGATSIPLNFPATVQNSGWEFVFTGKPVASENLQWNSTINVSINHNKLLSFPDLATSSYSNNYKVGQPIDIQYLLKYAGVNPQTGLYQFAKADGTISSTIAYPNDYVAISQLPKFNGGWTNNISYKGLTLDVLVSFFKGKKRSSGAVAFGSWLPGWMRNQPSSLDYWIKPTDVTTAQRLTSSFNGDVVSNYFNAFNSTYSITDGSFLRVKNVSLSYRFPTRWSDKARMKSMSIFGSAQNLLTFTKYKGLDPESGDEDLPPLRVITVGIQVTF